MIDEDFVVLIISLVGQRVAVARYCYLIIDWYRYRSTTPYL